MRPLMRHHSPPMTRREMLGGLAATGLLLAGCGSDSGSTPSGSTPASGPAASTPVSPAPGTLHIVTTCGMVTDIVRVVAGGNGTVEGLMQEGVDPHLFTAGRNDVQKLLQADVVFYCGLMLEGRMGDDFESLQSKGRKVFAVTDGIAKDRLREPPEFEGHPDPHVWMDVSLWSHCVGVVAERLSTVDPAHADGYRQRAEAYQAELAGLHAWIKERVATIPAPQRYLITAHDAFGYFARAYDIEVRAIQGVSTDSEPALADTNLLVDFIVEKKIPALFVESSVNPKYLEAVIEGCAQRGTVIARGPELFSDAMGTPGTWEGTYMGMMDHNTTAITRALGGQAPEGGWKGRLSGGHSAPTDPQAASAADAQPRP